MKLGPFFARSGMFVVFLVVVVAAVAFVPKFATWDNMVSLALASVTVGIVSCGMLFCLAGGDFDLSVGSTLALGGMVAVLAVNRFDSFAAGLAVALAVGGVVGALNGFVIAKLGINALIATLATMQIVRGVANIISQGSPVMATKEGFDSLGNGGWLGIQYPVWITVATFLVFGFLLNKTVFGRNTLAIGGNPEAARLAGIPVVRTKITIFMLSGMLAAFAGVLSASRMVAASNNAGDKLELQAISACVLGGVSLAGGVGSVGGVLIGVLIMGIVQNGMSLLNLDSFYQMVVTGAILLAAVLLDRFKTRVLSQART